MVVTNCIGEAPRQNWTTLEPITKLKCGISKGIKLDALNEVFYLTPQSLPEVINDLTTLNTLTSAELKAMAKKRGLSGYSKKKKNELIELLSQ